MSAPERERDALPARVDALEQEMRELGEEVEDLASPLLVEERLAESAGRRHRLEDVAEELGLGSGASIVYTDDEYDALSERLGAPAEPNERLRRTMSGAKTER